MAEFRDDGVLADRWHPVFRHSAGRLGSEFLTALRKERRLRAWKSQGPQTTTLPPKNFGGAGEWLDVGPGATLLGYVPGEWTAGSGDVSARGLAVGRVLVDGSDTPLFALVDLPRGGDVRRGARLTVRFPAAPAPGAAGTEPDFWFALDPAASAQGAKR